MPDWRRLIEHPAYRRQLLAVAAIVLAIAGFLVCLAFGHWARDPDPSIGRTFPIPSRRGMHYVTLPGLAGVIVVVVALVWVSFNWPRHWGPVREET
jgi:hypothetical protein